MIQLKRGTEKLLVKEIYLDYFLAKGYELIEFEEEIKAVLKPPKKKTAQTIPAVEAELSVSVEEVGNDDSKGDQS
jgi:hypothetical protein